jgi:hypothetical protein
VAYFCPTLGGLVSVSHRSASNRSASDRLASSNESRHPHDRPHRKVPRTRPRAVVEIVLLLGLFTFYKFVRAIAADRDAVAFHHGNQIWDAERWLHLPSESTVQALLLHSHDLARGANMYYAYVHFPATIAFLVWLYVSRPARYVIARRTLVLLTSAALVIHLAYPLAPPRLVTDLGLVDLAAKVGPAVYNSAGAQATVNQFAAMPSLHAGWATLVALEVIRSASTRWRWLIVAHPVVTVIVIVGTANHYWLDIVVALALLGAAMVVAPHVSLASFGLARLAQFTPATLNGATLSGATVNGANLNGANLSGAPTARSVTTGSVASADIVSSATRLRQGVAPRSSQARRSQLRPSPGKPVRFPMGAAARGPDRPVQPQLLE